ncbi:MAG TPA: hypothetical protein VMT70_05000, partial [Vicinamibacteria bacterium]|nr:hypothetical protein [Vicinamibacteria bacterium]
LTGEEVRIAAQLALSQMDLPPAVLEAVVERSPTHAALTPRERGYTFVHDRFFHYYLAVRWRQTLLEGAAASARAMLQAKELPPDVASWLEWLLPVGSTARETALRNCLSLLQEDDAPSRTCEANVSQLVSVLMHSSRSTPTVEKLTFVEDAMRGRAYIDVKFARCKFWQLDASGTKFTGCTFDGCEFGDVLLDQNTEFGNCTFVSCVIRGLETGDDRVMFEPDQIRRALEARGATFVTPTEAVASRAGRVDERVARAVVRLVRRSQRASDMTAEEIGEYVHDPKRIMSAMIETGVLKEHEKITSGPHRDFYRFQVDRQLLLRGQAEATGDPRIDNFWDTIAQRFPRSQ